MKQFASTQFIRVLFVIQGGLDAYGGSPTALTAYILLSLLESDVPLPRSLVNNGLKCLEKGIASGDASTYTMVLTTYVLALSEHPKANSTMKSLMNIATRSNVRIILKRTQPTINIVHFNIVHLMYIG